VVKESMSRVLVVDDDPNIRSLVADLLQDEGYEVATAANGAEALARVQDEPPTAIVLDLMMPVMDGWRFVELCRGVAACADVPIVVMSAAHGLSESAQALVEKGVRAVVAKPFDLEALVAVVERYAPR
jgi:CheY-like chemotaxis protein